MTMKSQSGLVSRFTLASGKSSCSFGQGVNTASDAPYPAGLASDVYELYVTAPGLASSPEGTFTPGTGYAGQTVSVVLAPAGSTPPAPTSAPTTAADNPDVVAPAAPADGGAASFFTTFWSKLLAFFYDADLEKSDAASLNSTMGKLFSYGPLGLPAQFRSQLEYASSFYAHTPANDPNYWVFPTFNSLPGLQSASLPDDIDKNQTFAPTYDDRLVHSFNSLSSANFGFDLHPYAGFILYGRWLVLAFVWFMFLRSQVERFTPEVRI